MRLERHNHETRIRKAPAWFLENIARHLSFEIDPTITNQFRLGLKWWYQGRAYGSLVRHDVVPAGLTEHVISLARYYDIPCSVHDARALPEDQIPLWSVLAQWRPYQDAVHEQTARYPCGVIDAPPRSGKTLMAARILDTKNLPSVVVAPSVQIVRQTYEVLLGQFGESFVSRLDGSATPAESDPAKQFVVSTPQGVLKMDAAWWSTRKLLIIDEFHHSASNMYHLINDRARDAYFRYGLTGTHFRTGADRLAMEAICSHQLYKIPVAYLVKNGWLAQPRVFFRQVSGSTRGSEFSIAYRNGIVNYEQRNILIAQTANFLLEQGIPTIVLTRQRKHADRLAERIHGAVAVKGGASMLTSQAVKDFNAGRHQALVGTTVLGEGVDIPRAGALVFASGGSDGVMMLQSYFRPLTASVGKDCGRIYDFVDNQHRSLQKHSIKRIEMVRSQLGSECVFVEP